MGMNRFLDPYSEGMGEPPGRYYARFDQLTEASVLLDAVGADWFDETMRDGAGFASLRERANEAAAFVIEIFATLYAVGNHYWFGTPKSSEHADEVDDAGIWLELRLGASQLPALLYPNLFGEGLPVEIAAIERLPDTKAGQLESVFSLDPFISDRPTIERALGNLHGTVEWIGVYDVGQGNANGLCDRNGMPLAYFDLGGGVLQNSASFSSLFGNICPTLQPPVILSHWDWDHWSSGSRFPAAQQLTWVVPNQKLGAAHAVFAAAILNSGGQILVWPDNLAQLSVGQATIHKCTGAGRNHSGLAVEVAGPGGEEPILLTGDARYSAIPTPTAHFASLVVPHHGADMRNRSVPQCPMHPGSRAAYSTGDPNSFTHPRPITEQDHHKAQWPHRSQGAPAPVDRHTAALRPQQLGHIGLTWAAGRALPAQPCGNGQCSLQLAQR